MSENEIWEKWKEYLDASNTAKKIKIEALRYVGVSMFFGGAILCSLYFLIPVLLCGYFFYKTDKLYNKASRFQIIKARELTEIILKSGR